MDNLVTSQIHIFLIFIINGIIIALIFDAFRILRKTFKTPDWLTYLEDILFWVISCIILAFSIYTYNNGEIRLYMFIGLLIGSILYIVTLSKYIIKTFVFIINKFKNIFKAIVFYVMYPIKLILKIVRKVLFKPINFININFKKNFAKILQKNLKKSAKYQ